MSYRPTISVYLDGEIIDIGYYRNWDDKELFYQAIALAVFFDDCRTREEYNARMYGREPELLAQMSDSDDEEAMK